METEPTYAVRMVRYQSGPVDEPAIGVRSSDHGNTSATIGCAVRRQEIEERIVTSECAEMPEQLPSHKQWITSNVGLRPPREWMYSLSMAVMFGRSFRSPVR